MEKKFETIVEDVANLTQRTTKLETAMTDVYATLNDFHQTQTKSSF